MFLVDSSHYPSKLDLCAPPPEQSFEVLVWLYKDVMSASEPIGHVKEIVSVPLCDYYWNTSKQQLGDPLNAFSIILSILEVFVVELPSTLVVPELV